MDAQEIFRRNLALMAEFEKQQALTSSVVSLDDFRPEQSSRPERSAEIIDLCEPRRDPDTPLLFFENLSKQQPWKAEGLSRATWYRRQREKNGKTYWGGRRRQLEEDNDVLHV